MVSIPTALSKSETRLLQFYASGKSVVEVGALLGYSTVALSHAARKVISIDKHTGYESRKNDSWNTYNRNLVTYNCKNVTPVIGDFSRMQEFKSNLTFIDLCGTYENTLKAIKMAKSRLILVHDYQRQNCKGVELAVKASGLKIIDRNDTLIVLEND